LRVSERNEGTATQGRFPPLPMKKPRNACVSEANDKIKKSVALRRYVSHQPGTPLVGTVERAFLKQVDRTLHLSVSAISFKFQYFFYCCHLMSFVVILFFGGTPSVLGAAALWPPVLAPKSDVAPPKNECEFLRGKGTNSARRAQHGRKTRGCG